jgi:hypothetical protein
MGVSAKGRRGDLTSEALVGRKTRRADRVANPADFSALVLSCAVDVPPPRLVRTRERASLDGTPHPHGSNPARFKPARWFAFVRAEIFALPRRYALSPFRRLAVSPIRPPTHPLAVLINTMRSIGSGRGSGPEPRIFHREKSNPETGICFQLGSMVIWAKSALVTTQTAEGALSKK